MSVLVLVVGTGACAEDSRESATADSPEDPTIRLVDDAGQALELTMPPQRIVSLVPSATSTLIWLGAEDALVGRTDFDTAIALAHLPSVGGGLGPSMEVLVSLHPDLVIRFEGDTDPNTPRRLDDLGIPHVAVRPSRVADVFRIIEMLGTLSGHREEADQGLAEIEQRLEAVRAGVSGLSPVRAAFLLDGSPPWAAGPGSYIGELIGLAGGVNVFDDLDREYAPVSAEELLARNLDVVLTVAGASPPGVPDHVRVATVSPVTQLPGPALGLSAEEIARALHPGISP